MAALPGIVAAVFKLMLPKCTEVGNEKNNFIVFILFSVFYLIRVNHQTNPPGQEDEIYVVADSAEFHGFKPALDSTFRKNNLYTSA